MSEKKIPKKESSVLLHSFNEFEEENSRFFGLTSKKKTIQKERSKSTSYKFNESEEGNSRFCGLKSKKNTIKRMLEIDFM